MRAAPFATIVLVSCASALQLPAQGRPRLVPLSRSDCSGGGGGLRVRSGPISCKTTDEDWARRWPNATPEELANMKKWCAAGPYSAQELGGHALTAPQHRAAPLRLLHSFAGARHLLLQVAQGAQVLSQVSCMCTSQTRHARMPSSARDPLSGSP